MQDNWSATVNHCVLWKESSFAKLKLLKERHFTLPRRKITFQSTLITQTIVGEGREEVKGSPNFPRLVQCTWTLHSPLLPYFSWLFPFSPFSITKYEALLHNFPLFLQPSPMHFPLLPPKPLLPPIFLGSHLPVLTRTSYNFLFWTTGTLNFS